MTVHWDVVIPALAVVVAAGIPSYANHRFLKKNVGKKNGKGNVVEMSEALIELFKAHARLDDERFNAISEQIDRNTTQIIDESGT